MLASFEMQTQLYDVSEKQPETCRDSGNRVARETSKNDARQSETARPVVRRARNWP